MWIPVVFIIASGAALAQDLTPSVSWKPNITSSKDESISVASAALEKALGYGMNYGYAAARSYTAHQDPDFLDLAVTSWTSARRYTISKEQAASGIVEAVSVIDDYNWSFHELRLTATLAGGTYRMIDFDALGLSGTASGAFLVVSALLAEATSNQTYLDAAIESTNFIQSHLLNPSDIVLASISSQSNNPCSIQPVTYSYDSGIFIEGLAILGDITHNASTETLLRSTIVATTTNPLWQGLDGIVTTTEPGGLFIMRALAALYERNTTSSDLRDYIKEYVGVQYNAVVEQARATDGSNIYGLPWTGPPNTSFSGVN
ncbi:uncharacterized protein EV420DRAFT_1640180 [Desarmillaria tabescens]|uniref:Uncharacterized protein n=1 Tax=Armillaria tabescens TaxID=1929756 RepID=A0AA39TS08_ARMTA|nr:uncharacterized protein EV420DRAFT_1640180 [Desarmillaria tabescens]KAK0461879.1 hypothetical protein EV420DRAFT_1640180 [Desarmillaria tabescens]